MSEIEKLTDEKQLQTQQISQLEQNIQKSSKLLFNILLKIFIY